MSRGSVTQAEQCRHRAGGLENAGGHKASETHAQALSKAESLIQDTGLMTAEDAGRRLGLAPKTLYNWVSAGRIPCVRIGRALRFEKDALDRIIAAGRRPASLDSDASSRPHGDNEKDERP